MTTRTDTHTNSTKYNIYGQRLMTM